MIGIGTEFTRASEVKQVNGIKYCSGCKEDMPVANFHRNRSQVDGYANRCKNCNNRDRSRRKKIDGSNRRWNQKNPHYFTVKLLGADPAEVRRLRDQHDGKCEICGTVPDKELCLDHDHATNAIRGFLCRDCNIGLGMFADNPDRLQQAIRYLTR